MNNTKIGMAMSPRATATGLIDIPIFVLIIPIVLAFVLNRRFKRRLRTNAKTIGMINTKIGMSMSPVAVALGLIAIPIFVLFIPIFLVFVLNRRFKRRQPEAK